MPQFPSFEKYKVLLHGIFCHNHNRKANVVVRVRHTARKRSSHGIFQPALADSVIAGMEQKLSSHEIFQKI